MVTSEFFEARWFDQVGERTDPQTQQWVERYLQALPGHCAVDAKSVDTWQDAMQLLREQRWDERWLQAEQAEAGRLLDQVRRRLGAREAAMTLATTLDRANERLMECAREALDRYAIVDDELARVAAGAAAQAVYEDALVRLAEAGADHAFRLKYELWRCGRWPLGVFRRHLQLF